MEQVSVAVRTRVDVSTVSLKWGDALSIFLPGCVALYAIAPLFPALTQIILNADKAGAVTGVALLIAATLCGGILEAITRITWEPLYLCKKCPAVDVLSRVTPENLELYERGVQTSYKYVTFYANFGVALAMLLLSHVFMAGPWSLGNAALLAAIVILLRASYVQWTYYVSYNSRIFGESH